MNNHIVQQMLSRYSSESKADVKNALKEIVQELALFALWRHKFFEHAAFYGGTALRILYQLDRFSEDLDFSLLQAEPDFSLKTYEEGIIRELESFGFEVSVDIKKKEKEGSIKSAFIKGNTLQYLMNIGVSTEQIHPDERLKIKIEVDVDPPGKFHTHAVNVFRPLPFSIRTYTLEDMFAGKMHALLFRTWNRRVKGRDWYDYLWFISRGISLNLEHLQERASQTGHWIADKKLELTDFRNLFYEKLENLDLELAKKDVIPFIKNPIYIEGWSKEMLKASVLQVKQQL